MKNIVFDTENTKYFITIEDKYVTVKYRKDTTRDYHVDNREYKEIRENSLMLALRKCIYLELEKEEKTLKEYKSKVESINKALVDWPAQ